MTGALPKVELHLHLEGAAPPAFIRGLAAEKHIDISGIFDERGNYTYRDFWDFLKVYEAATSVLTSPRDYDRLTRAVLAESAASGVIYSECFLSPDFCGGRDVGAWREYLHAIREAAEAVERQDGIILRGIITPIRHFGPEKARETARCAAETAGDWIVGFGLAGDEKIAAPLVLRLRARGGAAPDLPRGRMGRAGERARRGARPWRGTDRPRGSRD
jgi:adenosine deaminase